MTCLIPIGEDADLLLLRPEDRDELYDLIDRNRDHLGPWLPWAASIDRAGVEAFIAYNVDRLTDDDGIQTVIVSGGALVGAIGSHDIDWQDRATNINYWLGTEVEGRGLATVAARRLTDHAIEGWRLNRVTMDVDVGNERGRAVPERLGYVEEGVLRQSRRFGDRYVDVARYAVLAADWEAETSGF